MLKEDIKLPEHRQYHSKTEWEPLRFFSDCLCNSNKFDLMLGFFSSSAIQTLSDGFALFLYNGGRMRLIINNILSEKDKQTIIQSEQNNDDYIFDLNNLKELRDTLSRKDKHFFECLAWLISQKRIDIKIIQPKSGIGIAHTKSGYFSDGINQIAFNGSCNFTRTALLSNKESIDVFCDWDGEKDSKRIDYYRQKNFDRIFNEMDDTVNYLDSSSIVTDINLTFGGKNIVNLLEQEQDLFCNEQKVVRPTLKKAIEKAKKDIEDKLLEIKLEEEKPRFPYPQGPRDYQRNAYENWRDNDQKGLFAMATGTGKTITALNCLLEIYKQCGYYKALILVPTITLVNQWEEECLKFNFRNIIKVFSKNTSWKSQISNIKTQYLLERSDSSYIVIATYASYSGNNFDILNIFPKRTLLIADECHNLGSSRMIKRLNEIKCQRRIGLSATPKRQYDDKGNEKINEFFNCHTGYTFSYTMQQAIENDVLCRYYYYPHLVQLTDSELKEYIELSIKISKYYNSNSDSFDKDPILTALLLKRKRVIHKAENKISIFADIIKDLFDKNNLKYTLVYVPEGNMPDDYFENDFFDEFDETEIDKESIHLIDIFTRIVRDLNKKVTVRKFISGVDERDEILNQFSKGEIDVLTSMKCLDEGVDIPRAETAIFCASTGNPRQFIQRRGRILRKHNEKEFAYIHDLIVIPEISKESESYEMERNLLKKELDRVKQFALLAENVGNTIDILFEVMNHYNLNLYNNEQ